MSASGHRNVGESRKGGAHQIEGDEPSSFQRREEEDFLLFQEGRGERGRYRKRREERERMNDGIDVLTLSLSLPLFLLATTPALDSLSLPLEELLLPV